MLGCELSGVDARVVTLGELITRLRGEAPIEGSASPDAFRLIPGERRDTTRWWGLDQTCGLLITGP